MLLTALRDHMPTVVVDVGVGVAEREDLAGARSRSPRGWSVSGRSGPGPQLRPPRPEASVPDPVHGEIRRRPVLGGLINPFEAAA